MASCGLSSKKSTDASVDEVKNTESKSTQAKTSKPKKAKKAYMSRRDQEAEIKRILKDLAGRNTKQIGKALHKRRKSLPRFLDELTTKYVTDPAMRRAEIISKQHPAEALSKA